MITRPIVPIYFGTPTPEGFKGPPQNPSHIGDNILNNFSHESGLGDIQLPLMVNLPKKYAGNWLFGMGPVFQFPTATNDALGQDQWALGPVMVLGYKGKRWLGGIFPNYFWKIGSAGQDSNTPDVNQGSLLYFFNYSLPDAWQVGFNPTITYNHRAPSGNKWRVPVGLYVGKTIKMGKVPVNIKVGGEYVVVTQDTFGERFTFKFIITPVMPSLIKSPIFGE